MSNYLQEIDFSKLFEEKKEVAGSDHNLPILSCTIDGIKNQNERFNKQIASKDNSNYLIAEYGEIVLSPLNLWMGGIGIQDICKKGVVSPAYKVFKVNSQKIFPQFAKYLVRCHQMIKLYGDVSASGASVVRKNLDLDLLKKSPIAIPKLNEQKKIAEILTLVDHVIELTAMEIDKLKDLKKGMMQDLLTKGIGHTQFKDSPVGKIPESWAVKTLQEICSKITDGTHDTPKVLTEGMPFITGKHIRDSFIDFESCDYVSKEEHEIIYKRCNPEYGDVIYVNIGAGTATPAFISITKPFSMKNIALLKPEKNILDGRFLEISLLFYKNKIFTQNINGGAQPFLGLKTIGEIQIALPSFAEQLQISKIIGSIEDNIKVKNIYLQKLGNEKKGLMNDLLTGKVRVKV